ncbi:hypothetical protein Tco_1545093, partial [Tanacetum coccineum]
MPPRRLKRRAIERMVQKRVNEAIAEYGRSSANPENAGGSVPANAWELLHRMCTDILGIDVPDLVTLEKKKTERYIRGLPERVKANVTSSKPTSLHDAINMARKLIEQAIQGKATRIGKSNKKLLRLMLQPQLRVEATLGTYLYAIGTRHIIMAHVLLGVILYRVDGGDFMRIL